MEITELVDQGREVDTIPVGGLSAFRFSLFSPGRVRLETEGVGGGCPFDTQLRLYEEVFGAFGLGYQEVAFDEDGGEGACGLIQQALPQGGTFLLIVNEFGADEEIELALDYQILLD